jgi:YidC/Oxa1 family membrane protein insertase
MSGFIPAVADYYPEFKKTLSGFTLYTNTVGTSQRTIGSFAPIFAGYDYTVDKINAREGELRDKFNQAYYLYTENFKKHGYRVNYIDPFWYNFNRRGDCAHIIEKADIHCSNVIDSVGGIRVQQHFGDDKKPELLSDVLSQYYSVALFRVVPASLKPLIYGNGKWLGRSLTWKKMQFKYLVNYFALSNMDKISEITAEGDTFTFMANNITRATLMLNDNCIPEKGLLPSNAEISTFKDKATVEAFHSTRCAMHAVKEYLDWFKENGIYDNTMFVIVSDHGWFAHNPLINGTDEEQVEHSQFQNLMMTKPFGVKGTFRETREFISNASVPGIICDIIGECVDSYLDKTVSSKTLDHAIKIHVTPWNPAGQKKDTFVVGDIYKVEKDISVPANWKKLK